tara:strand:+ start:307 stop:537 length:231 start_codon:yes stop_codon:yes gene_type:complete
MMNMIEMKEIKRLGKVDENNKLVTYRVVGTPIGTSEYVGAPYCLETSRGGNKWQRWYMRFGYKSSAMRALKREVAR